MIVNNVSYDIRPGMLCIFQPYQLHHLTLEYDGGQCFERSIAIFEPTLFRSYFEKWPALREFFHCIHSAELPYPCLYEIDDPTLDHVYKSMHDRIPALSDSDTKKFRCFSSLYFAP